MKIKKASPFFGAIISEFSLKDDLNEASISKIRNLFFKYEVLFFKKQPPLKAAEYFEIVSRLFDTMKHPFSSHKKPIVPGISPFQPYTDFPEITGIRHNAENKGNLNEWHGDLNWLKNPSLGSALRAVKIPLHGGDTIWASMTAAYNNLDDDTKKEIEGLQAFHDFTQIYQGCFAKEKGSLQRAQGLFPRQAHPIVLKHPFSSKKGIFVNRVSTTGIPDWPNEKSQPLLEKLYRLASIPEFQYRYQWRENDIVFWDNLTTQHYAVSDYWPAKRWMERISLAGVKIEGNEK